MKILFVGTFLKAQSTHYPIAREFKKKNNEVYVFKFRQIAINHTHIKSYWYNRKLRIYFESFIIRRPYLPNRIKSLKYYLFGNWYMNRLLLSLVKTYHFDLILFAKADTINYKKINRFNKFSKTFYYFVDPIKIAYSTNAFKYASLTNWASASTSAMNLLFEKEGAKSYYILEGFNEKIFCPGKENRHKVIDVIFVGSVTPDRKTYIDYLTKCGINVICHGRGWENGPIFLENLVKKYRTSKIILNFPREDSGFSDRVFQVMGTGSFLLSKYCSDLERVFKRKVHLDWFEAPEECVNLITFYLEHEDVREEIAQNGHNYVLKNFTWENMVQKINKIITQ